MTVCSMMPATAPAIMWVPSEAPLGRLSYSSPSIGGAGAAAGGGPGPGGAAALLPTPQLSSIGPVTAAGRSGWRRHWAEGSARGSRAAAAPL